MLPLIQLHHGHAGTNHRFITTLEYNINNTRPEIDFPNNEIELYAPSFLSNNFFFHTDPSNCTVHPYSARYLQTRIYYFCAVHVVAR
jgi:hypothetical protein